MDGVQVLYHPTEHHNQELASLVTPLIDVLHIEFEALSTKPLSQTMKCIMQCKNTLTFMRAFLWEDNGEAVLRTSMNHPTFINDLKKCFRGKPKEDANRALEMYATIVDGLIGFYSIKNV